MTTEDAITKFLETYGSSDPAQDALLERLIFNPVPPDYTSLLEQEEGHIPSPAATEAPATGHDALIDAFLAGGPDEETIPPPSPCTSPSPWCTRHPARPRPKTRRSPRASPRSTSARSDMTRLLKLFTL